VNLCSYFFLQAATAFRPTPDQIALAHDVFAAAVATAKPKKIMWLFWKKNIALSFWKQRNHTPAAEPLSGQVAEIVRTAGHGADSDLESRDATGAEFAKSLISLDLFKSSTPT
jgi:hypothetical protein